MEAPGEGSRRPADRHGARHAHAAPALAAGARLYVVSRQLGHASIANTADVYGHPDGDEAAKVASLMSAVLDPEGGLS